MKEVDSRGKRCPQPIIDLARSLSQYPEEYEFLLLSDDPATESDLGAWSRMTGHTLSKEGSDRYHISRKTEREGEPAS